MGEDGKTLEDLLKLVLSCPDDHVARRRLVEALIERGHYDAAADHLQTLVEAQLPDPATLLLGVRVSLAAGNHLQAARYRKQLRQLKLSGPPGDDDQDEDGDELWGPFVHPSHPSQQTRGRPVLRLIAGGAIDSLPSGPTASKLSEVAGLETVKRNLSELINRVRSNESAKLGAWQGGILLYGPPHCGKAFLAGVIAGELDATLLSFDLATPWLPNSLAQVVDKAIKTAKDNPAILYFDNLDAQETKLIHPHGPLGPVLARLDQISPGYPITILGAATFPWLVNAQVVRPGRLGRVLLVLPPDAPARRMLLEERFEEHAIITGDDLDWLVARTEGHSFGDLEELVGRCVALSLQEGSYQNSEPVLTHAHVRKARQQASASSASWLSLAGHHAMMNESGGIYDDLLIYFRSRQRH